MDIKKTSQTRSTWSLIIQAWLEWRFCTWYQFCFWTGLEWSLHSKLHPWYVLSLKQFVQHSSGLLTYSSSIYSHQAQCTANNGQHSHGYNSQDSYFWHSPLRCTLDTSNTHKSSNINLKMRKKRLKKKHRSSKMEMNSSTKNDIIIHSIIFIIILFILLKLLISRLFYVILYYK